MTKLLSEFVRATIEPFLSSNRFKREEDHYVRLANACEHYIGIAEMRSTEVGTPFSIGVRVRHPEVEYLADLGQPDPDKLGTIGGLIHILHPPYRYYEWILGEDTDKESLAEEIINRLQGVALPFLAKYSSLDSVKESVTSPDPHQRFVLDSQRRFQVLAAIHWIEGDRAEALNVLSGEIDKRKDDFPKYRMHMEEMLRYLEDQAGQPNSG